MKTAVDVDPDSGAENSHIRAMMDSVHHHPIEYTTVDSAMDPTATTTDEDDGNVTSEEHHEQRRHHQQQRQQRINVIRPQDINEDVSSHEYTNLITDLEPITTDGLTGTEDATETEIEHTDADDPTEHNTDDDDKNQTTETEEMSSEEGGEEDVEQIPQNHSLQPTQQVLFIGKGPTSLDTTVIDLNSNRVSLHPSSATHDTSGATKFRQFSPVPMSGSTSVGTYSFRAPTLGRSNESYNLASINHPNSSWTTTRAVVPHNVTTIKPALTQSLTLNSGTTYPSPVTSSNYTTVRSVTRLPVNTSLPLSSIKPTISPLNTPSTVLTTPVATSNIHHSVNAYQYGSMTTSGAQYMKPNIFSPLAPVNRQFSKESGVSRTVSVAASQTSRLIPKGTIVASTPHTTPARVWTSHPDEMMTFPATGAQTTPHDCTTRGISTASGTNRQTMTAAPFPMNVPVQPLGTSGLVVEPSQFIIPNHGSAAAPFMTAPINDVYHPAAPYLAYQPIVPAVTTSISQASMLDTPEAVGGLMKTARGDAMTQHLKQQKNDQISKKGKCFCTC